MEDNLIKIKEILSDSDLDSQDQDDLIVLFSMARDEDLEPVVKLFSENPTWIKKISENYKSKEEAITAQNQDLWQKIIQEEENQLKELEK